MSPSSGTLQCPASFQEFDRPSDAPSILEIWNGYLDALEASMRDVAHSLATDPAAFDPGTGVETEAPPEGTMPPELTPRASSLVARLADLSKCVEDEMRSLTRRRAADRPRTIPIYIDSRF